MKTKARIQKEMMKRLQDIPKQISKNLTVSDFGKSFKMEIQRIKHEQE